jgi:lipopolysaccharide biosynthesis glycosyltransferase
VSEETLIVCSCDRNYFPLVKGLILSILEAGPLPAGIGIGFIDIGCDEPALHWLAERGVRVRKLEEASVGRLADCAFGYQRAQACRPFLPRIFPEARVLIWMDSDMWVQDRSVFAYLRDAAHADPDKLFICPECHYSYLPINDAPQLRRQEMFSYYEPPFGAEVARRLCERFTLNSGFFAMHAANAIWADWTRQVQRIFLDEYERYSPIVRHMADQTALNVIANGTARLQVLDPLYNYISHWTTPIRGQDGVVRVALPPHVPIGIVHLTGGLEHFGRKYFERGLLYRAGAYLRQDEERTLFGEAAARTRLYN